MKKIKTNIKDVKIKNNRVNVIIFIRNFTIEGGFL
jgi:hypothetical protein